LLPFAETDQVLVGAEAVAKQVEAKTGIVIKPMVAQGYAGAIDAMCNGEAHVAAFTSFCYLLARNRGCAEVALVASRFGSTYYSSQVVAGADTGIMSLADLAGATFCRPDPNSASGWLIPGIAMRAEGLDPNRDLGEIVNTEGHDGVVQAIYTGECEAGATWVDARALVENELPDVRERVVVIAESAPIPNDTLNFAPSLTASQRENLTAAFLQLSAEDVGPEAWGSPQRWQSWEPVNDSFFDGLRKQLEAAGVWVEDVAR
jgi:phosphonate transport system substrate-binding protein